MFLDIKEGTSLILSGNNTAVQVYRDFIDEYFLYYDFVAVADSAGEQNRLYVRGLPIVSYGEWTSYDGMLVLFHDNWYEEAEKLHQQGYVLLRDFVPVWFFKIGFQRRTISMNSLLKTVQGNLDPYIRYISYVKKIAFVFGDGNTPNFVKVLSHVKEFVEEYVILSVPAAQDIKIEHYEKLKPLWKYVRCLLIQPVDKNKEITSRSIKRAVNRSCKIVQFPRLFFWAYFPQTYVLDNRPVLRKNDGSTEKYMPFLFGDKNIRDGLKENLNISDMQNFLENNDFYIETFLKEYFEKSLNAVRKEEQECDIQISNWIEANYKTEKLFFTPTRAALPMLKYVIEEVLHYMGIDRISYDQKNIPLKLDGEVPIYQSVAYHLRLGFDTKMVHCCDAYYGDALEREDYVKEYVEIRKGQ